MISFQWNVGPNDEEVTVEVSRFRFGRPERVSGPVELCHEAEPDSCSYTVLKEDGSEYEPTPDEDEQIREEIRDRAYEEQYLQYEE
jgi:hypothetical protein